MYSVSVIFGCRPSNINETVLILTSLPRLKFHRVLFGLLLFSAGALPSPLSLISIPEVLDACCFWRDEDFPVELGAAVPAALDFILSGA